jgi:hypothetical protein
MNRQGNPLSELKGEKWNEYFHVNEELFEI